MGLLDKSDVALRSIEEIFKSRKDTRCCWQPDSMLAFSSHGRLVGIGIRFRIYAVHNPCRRDQNERRNQSKEAWVERGVRNHAEDTQKARKGKSRNIHHACLVRCLVSHTRSPTPASKASNQLDRRNTKGNFGCAFVTRSRIH